MDKIAELRKRLIQSAKKNIREKYGGKETHIIRAVNILEDLDMASNLLAEQLREWYSAHFPELSELVKDDAKYAELVHTLGARKNFSRKEAEKILADAETAKNIEEKGKNSMGSAITEEDMAEIKTLALNCRNMKQEREYLADYVERGMEEELPNFTEIAGPIIGAKILAKAGSKKRLAFMPASTIQLVGAEKALFLHIKKGVKGPKYGYLFQHPMVKGAPKEHKGKMARSIAAKLAIAAKKDYFGNRSPASGMREELRERSEELEKRKRKEKPEKERGGADNRTAKKPGPKGRRKPPHADKGGMNRGNRGSRGKNPRKKFSGKKRRERPR